MNPPPQDDVDSASARDGDGHDVDESAMAGTATPAEAIPAPPPPPVEALSTDAPATDAPATDAPALEASATPTQLAALPPEPPPEPRDVPFVFTGDAGEYFRIWIVNVALTIVTLGIYSAWAKYRTKQYFHRHTQLDGSSFEYLANPLQLLKGRIIVAVALGILFGAQAFNPALYFTVLMVYLVLSPFLMVNALRFNARNSAWRHVPFGFNGKTDAAYTLYAKMLGWAMITCNLAAPYTQWLWSQFVMGHHRFGDQPFRWETKSKQYIELYIMMVPMVMVIYFITFGGIMLATMVGSATGAETDPDTVGGLGEMVTVGMIGLMYTFMLIPGAYFKANVANLVFGGVRVGDHSLRCEQKWTELLKIYVLNAVALLFSLGLAYPWAKIQLAAYRTSKLTLVAVGPLDVSRGEAGDHTNAIGDAAMDLGDLDLDLGF